MRGPSTYDPVQVVETNETSWLRVGGLQELTPPTQASPHAKYGAGINGIGFAPPAQPTGLGELELNHQSPSLQSEDVGKRVKHALAWHRPALTRR